MALVQVSCAAQEVQSPTIEFEQVHDSGAHRIAFDPAGNRLASGGFRGKVHIWSVYGGRLISSLDNHRASIRGLAWLDDTTLVSADGRYAASSAEDGSVHIYDLNAPYRPIVPYPEDY